MKRHKRSRTEMRKITAMTLCIAMILTMLPAMSMTASAESTEDSTVESTTEPTVEPTTEPTVEPTTEPTVEPTTEPTVEPTPEPTEEPTLEPMLMTLAAEPTPLTFTAQTNNSSVTFWYEYAVNSKVWYKTDGDWSDYRKGTTINLNENQTVSFKGSNVKTGPNYSHFIMAGSIAASGDVTSLTNEEGGDAELDASCYQYMFQDCESLTTAPNLPATTLADSCYFSMFEGCKSLTTAPNLPATTLASKCYYSMFEGCTNLSTVPELNATILAGSCYSNMFNGCTALATAPKLDAKALAQFCYSNMFNGCTALATAPVLPATTLADSCYFSMFEGCTNLSTVPELNATILADSCYRYMFSRCTSLVINKEKSEKYSCTWIIPVAKTNASAWNNYMFWGTGGSLNKANPQLNTTYYIYSGDKTPPAISGIEDKKIYSMPVEFTVTDDELSTVTVNGESVTLSDEGKYTLSTSGVYIVVATDQSGNRTTVTVTLTEKNTVKVPVITSKPYTGQNQTAVVSENSAYTVTRNAGGTNVGTYDVVLTLTDKEETEWESASDPDTYVVDNTAGTVTCKFEITKANNSFTEDLSCAGFTYDGTTAAQASAAATFGSLVYTYYTDADCTSETSTEEGATAAGGAPKNAGTYYVKATVAGTDNYNGLTRDKISFAIEKANQTAPTVGHTGVSYTGQRDGVITGITAEMEWTTTPGDDNSWTKVTPTQINDGKMTGLGAGTYYIRMEEDRNHNIGAVTTVVIESINKIPVKVLIAAPVYDKDHLDQVTVKGIVTKGEYDVTAQNFEYRKEGDSSWIAIPSIGSDVILTGLSADTIYEVKLTAKDSNGTVVTDTKKFKTLQEKVEIGKITGSVDGADNKQFSVSIKRGSTIVGTLTELNKGDTFTFSNLADGEYNLEVTDGEFKVTNLVTVKNGSTQDIGVVKVTEKQTVVEVQEGAPDVAVGGLDKVFDADSVAQNSNAQEILENGGTIEIRLTASETTDPTSTTKLTDKADESGKVIGMMTDLNVDLITIPLGGDATSSSITDTKQLILIAIPLAEGAKGKNGYQAYRVHEGETRKLVELDSSERANPTQEGFYIDGDYLYVVARYFSSFALAYDKETEPGNPGNPGDSGDSGNPGDPSTTVTVKKPAATVITTVNKKSIAANTGDESPVMPFAILLLVSGAGLLALVIERKRRIFENENG